MKFIFIILLTKTWHNLEIILLCTQSLVTIRIIRQKKRNIEVIIFVKYYLMILMVSQLEYGFDECNILRLTMFIEINNQCCIFKCI